MGRERSWTDDQLIEAVKKSVNYSEVARELGLSTGPGNRQSIKRGIRELKLPTSHFTFNGRTSYTKGIEKTQKPINYYLVKDGPRIHNQDLRKRLIKESLLEDRCYGPKCKITKTWLRKEIVLELDHIDGDKNNNELSNLRFLCPNCHSQTETWCNRGLKNSKANLCKDCKSPISRQAVRCRGCAAKQIQKEGSRNHNTKIEWPPSNQLQKMVEESNFLQVGKKLGVSDNAVRKRLQNHPPS